MSVKKEDQVQLITNAPNYAALDTTHIDEGSYSVRIPEFIKTGWERLQQTTQVGEVTIEHYGPGTKPKMIIRLNGAVPYEVPIDKFPETFEIKFDPQKSVNNQYIFTVAPDSGYVRMSGKVISSGHLTSDDVERMTYCREYVENQAKSTKKEKMKKGKTVLDSSNRASLISNKANVIQKREFKDRTTRMSHQQLQSELFVLFNNEPEWSLQDLAKTLKQNAQDIS